MSFIPLSVPVFRGNELKYVSECIETAWVSSAGSYVNQFEKQITEKTGAKHAIACVNGTAALHISLLLAGVGRDDMVLVPTLTFIAPVNTVRYVGATPVFMDCDDNLNMDPQKVEDFCEQECQFREGQLFHQETGSAIKALIVVHVFGHPANLEKLMGLAEKYNLKLIEDATESLGSYYKEGPLQGRHTGTIGHLGCYSFNGNKIITTGGGGMIVTDRQDLAERARYLTTQAKDDEIHFIHGDVGYNYRLTNLQSALGVAQLEQLDLILETKRKNFQLYYKELQGYQDLKMVEEPRGTFSNYWHYTLLVPPLPGKTRDHLMQYLFENKIQTRPLWELNHRQKPYTGDPSYKVEKSPWFHARGLSLPCSADLTESQVERVCTTIKSFLR